MATFGSDTFGESRAGQYNLWHGAKIRTAVRAIPGGTYVLQISGDDPAELALPVVVTAAEYSTLKNDIGSTQTLTYGGGTVTATLAEVSAAQEINPYGATVKLFATLTFLI